MKFNVCFYLKLNVVFVSHMKSVILLIQIKLLYGDTFGVTALQLSRLSNLALTPL